ncbi:GNAT family N-acetyltransferase [bacterium]|nr:GNAT family N-acetyltransferase [bacterium]
MIEIKRLTQDDVNLVTEIVSRFWPQGKLNGDFLKKDSNHLLVAYVEGNLAGFLYAYELERIETDKPMMFFYSIDVLPEYHRKGIGKRLISELKLICSERHVSKMYVLTDEANVAAMKLYESTGGLRQSPDSLLFLYKEWV